MDKIDRTAIRKVKLKDVQSDFAYWQSRPYQERLEALEKIRQEYNSWKYGTEQGFQRVYTIIKRK